MLTYFLKRSRRDFPLCLLCLQVRTPIPQRQPAPSRPPEYVKSGAIRILNRGQRNARGRTVVTVVPSAQVRSGCLRKLV